MSDPLIKVNNLENYYYEQNTILDKLLGREKVKIRAVDGVSFEIYEGETFGLVGESGCGKSTTGETILSLREATGGRVRFDGENISDMNEFTEFRRRTGIVFQDPFSSLDPRMTIGEIIREPLEIHSVGRKDHRRVRAQELLKRVGLSDYQLNRYPNEFSGGQQQRIAIARSLTLEPDFLVLDEPVTALDVSIQAQILNLLVELQEDFDLTYLFIAHDLSVVRYICDRLAVMYLGEIVEKGSTTRVFESPAHPYTEALLDSVLRANTSEGDREIESLSGDMPSPRNPPNGCRFHTRCPKIIPPDNIDLSQDQYRQMQNLRDRIESKEINLDGLRSEGKGITAVTEQFCDQKFRSELPPSERRVVNEVIKDLERGDYEKAAERLTERYESKCETTRPEGELASCHLNNSNVR